MVALRIRRYLDTIERLWYNIGGVFYIGGKDAMPKKEGAGGKPQEYDADSGQYGDGTSSDTQKDKSGESGKPKTSKKKKLCVDTPEAYGNRTHRSHFCKFGNVFLVHARKYNSNGRSHINFLPLIRLYRLFRLREFCRSF